MPSCSRVLAVLALFAALLAVVLDDVAALPRPAPQMGGYPDCQDDGGGDDDYGDGGGGEYNNGVYGQGDSGYAQGYNAYSSYSGYGAGNVGGYGGGYADPSGRSASSFGVGYGR